MRAGRLSRSSLVLTSDSPAWASLARFRAPDVRAAIRSELPELRWLREVRVIVREPETAADSGPDAAHRSLSPFAARVLRSVARSIDDPRLARVLMRLAARERPPAGAGSASGSSPSGVNRPRRDGRR